MSISFLLLTSLSHASGWTAALVAAAASGATAWAVYYFLQKQFQKKWQKFEAERNEVLSADKNVRQNLMLERNESQTLNQIVMAINQTEDRDEMLRAVIEQGMKLIPQAEKAGFLMFDKTTQKFWFSCVAGYDEALTKNIRLSWEEAVNRYSIGSQELQRGVYLVTEFDKHGSVQFQNLPQPKAMLAMSIVYQGEIAGFTLFDNLTDAKAFSTADVERLQHYREHVALIFGRIMALEETKRQNRQLETLDKIVQIINRQDDFKALLSSMLQQGGVLLPQAEKGAILLRDEKDGLYRFEISLGYDYALLKDITLTQSETVARYLTNARESAPDIFVLEATGRQAAEKVSNLPEPESMLALPIRIENELEAVVVFDNFSGVFQLSNNDLANLARFREHAAAAFLKARRQKAIQQQAEELKTFERIVKTINEKVEFQDVLRALLEQGFSLIPQAEKGGFLVYEPDSKIFKIAVVYGYDAEGLKDVMIGWKESIRQFFRAAEVLNDGVFIVNPQKAYLRETPHLNELPKPKSTLAMSVIVEEQIAGLIIFDNLTQENAFKKSDVEKMSLFREHAESAFAKARLMEALKKQKKQVELANLAVQETNEELLAVNELMELKNKDLHDSINYARRIQEVILPDVKEIQQVLPECFVFYKPRDVVSGDFFWFAQQKGKIILVCADCTGHGVPGAFMSVMGATLLNQVVNEKGIVHPANILTEMDKEIKTMLKQQQEGNHRNDGMEMGVCAIDPVKKTVVFAGANRPIFYAKDNEIATEKGNKHPLGGNLHGIAHLFISQDYNGRYLSPFYMTTDGFIDQFGGPEGRKFMTKRFAELLKEIQSLPMHIQKQVLEERFEDWKGNREQVDDVLVIGFRV